MNKKIIIILVLSLILPASVFAQQVTVRGYVADNAGEPLIGATVVEVDKPGNGVLTNIDGRFTITVSSSKSEIKISYIGFRNVVVKADSQKELRIAMDNDDQLLDEVVIVGFGKQNRKTTIGAISDIGSKEIRQSPTASLQNALVGKLPGLFQQQTSGQPGADAANIYIRGISTFADVSKSPLVLIDDIETDYSILSQLDPNEVENISILKDASSTAIYGVKGANGVILVTTRRGTEGPPRITIRSEYGIQSRTTKDKTLGSYESLVLLKEYWENLEKNPEVELPGLVTAEALEHFRTGDMPYVYPDVDWMNAVMRKTTSQIRENVDISGGNKTVKYFLSLGYLHQDGIMKNVSRDEDFNPNYYLRRYNVRTNFDIQATKDLKLAVNVSAILNEKNEPHTPDPRSDGGAWPLFRRLNSGILPPWAYPIKNEDGSYGGNTMYSVNPIMTMEYAGYKRQFRNNINGNISAEQKLDFVTKGLKIKGTMALTNLWGYNRSLTRDEFPDFMYNKETGILERVKPGVNPLPVMAVNTNTTVAPYIAPSRKITTQLILNYDRTFGVHSISALGLLNWDTYKSGHGDPQNFRGISGRVAYNYAQRYLFEFNIGYNGSDRFKAKNKYGTFPAVSIGWNASEESFLKTPLKAIAIDFLKIRANYGLVGSDQFNSNNRYLYQEEYSRSDTDNNSAWFGENPHKIPSIYPGKLGNDDVRWEKDKKLDIGLDLRMFDTRLSLVLDYFYNERYDILTNRSTITYISGISSPPVNLGRVENKGFEIEATWRDQIGKVNYFVKGNVSVAKNKILEIDEVEEPIYPLQKKTGRPIGQIFGYIWDGYYQSEEEIAAMPDNNRGNLKPGDLRYKDISGPDGVPDGVIDRYDYGPIGNPSVPKVTFGLSTGFSWGNFDFSVLFQGAAKGSIMSSTILQVGGVNGRPREIHLDRWTPENKEKARFPRLGGSNFDNSTYWLRPRDYIRLKNVELGYNIPKSFTSKLGMYSARLYANGLNLFTWSNLSIYDVDPESNSGDTAAYSSYPQMKVFNFGLQVTF